MGRALLALLLLTLAGCATLAGKPVPNIYVVRHLHTPAGVPNAQLTAQGRAAAERSGCPRTTRTATRRARSRPPPR